MASISQVSNDQNIANFEDLISRCVGFGPTYNPSLAAIKIANMNTQKTSCANAQANTSTTINVLKGATNSREIVFLPLKKLGTRIVAAVKACGASPQTVKDVITYNNKLQGKRAKPIKKAASQEEERTVDPMPEPIEVIVHISVSQQGYDSKVEYLSKMIDLLGTIPAYAPNENDLKIASLNALLAAMKASNTVVINATTNVKNAAILRNGLLYKDVTGLCDVAQEVKDYVKSVYGATSGQYKTVRAIKFFKRKGLPM
jgi:hypothetical protein